MMTEAKIRRFTQNLTDPPAVIVDLLAGPVADIRLWLKSKGWRRADRHNEELWNAPLDLKWTCVGVSLASAVKAQLRQEGLDTSKLRA